MKKIITIAIFFSLLFATKGYSQESYMSVNYGVSFTSGNMHDFISKVSWRGGLIEYRYSVNDNLFVGVDVGWYVFYEKKNYDTYTSGVETLSGVQYRYQNEVPILVSAEYFISAFNSVKPYVGFGIGTMYSERSIDMGMYRLKQNPWHFAIKPEVGVLWEMSYSTALKVAGKYYNGFKAGDLDNQGYFSISVGFAFKL